MHCVMRILHFSLEINVRRRIRNPSQIIFNERFLWFCIRICKLIMRQQSVVILGKHSCWITNFSINFPDFIGIHPLLIMNSNPKIEIKLIFLQRIQRQNFSFPFGHKIISNANRHLIWNDLAYRSAGSVWNRSHVVVEKVFHHFRVIWPRVRLPWNYQLLVLI